MNEEQNQDTDDDAEVIEDEAANDDSPSHAKYEMTSFGIDFDTVGLVRRLQLGDILIPEWQRNFIWSFRNASRFIESLLLNLPVPGVFLGTDPHTNQLYVVDGQQRLRTIQGFFEGKFPGGDGTRVFALDGVDERFKGATYSELPEADRRSLDNSIIHGTVVRQDSPDDGDTSMYQLFERLNSGGRQVYPQEIRCAVYQGALIDAIKDLNEDPDWRSIVGRPSIRLRDQEMILRFMAMHYQGGDYSRPMADFLSAFADKNRNPSSEWINETSELFKRVVSSFASAKGTAAFRVTGGRIVNAAVFDSMSVGLAQRLTEHRPLDVESISAVHDGLIKRLDYLGAVTSGTSQERSVETRMRIAKSAFADA